MWVFSDPYIPLILPLYGNMQAKESHVNLEKQYVLKNFRTDFKIDKTLLTFYKNNKKMENDFVQKRFTNSF